MCSHFHNIQKKVCGYLVCFKSIRKLASGRRAGQGTILPHTPAGAVCALFKNFLKCFFFFFLENQRTRINLSVHLVVFLVSLLTRVTTGALFRLYFQCSLFLLLLLLLMNSDLWRPRAEFKFLWVLLLLAGWVSF